MLTNFPSLAKPSPLATPLRPGPSSHALTPAIIQVSSQSPAAAPPSVPLPVSPGGFFPQPLSVCKRLGDMRHDTSSKRLQKLVHVPASKPGPYILSPPSRNGTWGVGRIEGSGFCIPGLEQNRADSTAPDLSSPTGSPPRSPPRTHTATHQFQGSQEGKGLLQHPEGACRGQLWTKEARERKRQREEGSGDAASGARGSRGITRAAQSVLPGSRGP